MSDAIKLTKGEPLPIGAILGAANADLERRKHNTVAHKLGLPYQQYAFHRDDVRDADDPKTIIARTLKRLEVDDAPPLEEVAEDFDGRRRAVAEGG